MNFEQECREWLSPLGYSIHAFSSDRNYIIFSPSMDHPNYPSIECTNRDGEKSCKVITGLEKLFINMEAGPLQFKHPDIELFIKTMAWYAGVCKDFPPVFIR